jgi:hypothetical protein
MVLRQRGKKKKANTTPVEVPDPHLDDNNDVYYLEYASEETHLTVYIQMYAEVVFTIPPLVAAICYTNSIYGQLFFDDKYAINRNQDVTDWHSPVSDIFTHDYWGMPISDPSSHKSYRPLVTLLFKLNHYIHGLQPVGYHICNILFHVCNTALVNMIGRRIFTYVIEHSIDVANAASMAALMFAVHPIHTEAVSSVVGRAEVMCCFFFLMSLYMGMRAAQPNHTKWGAVAMSLVHMVAAMLCKEQGITVMGVLFFFDMLCVLDPWWGKEEGYPTLIERFWTFLKRNTVYVTLSCLFLKWRMSLNAGTMPTWPKLDNPPAAGNDLMAKLLNYPYIYAHNAWLMLFPWNLCGDYTYNSIAVIEGISDWRNLLTLLFLASFVGLLYMGFGGGGRDTMYDGQSPPASSEKKRQMDFIARQQQRDHSKRKTVKPTSEHAVSTSTAAPTTTVSATTSATTSATVPANSPLLIIRRDLLMAMLMIVLPFLPSSNIFFPVGFLIAERVLYIPSVGQALLFGSLCARTWDRTWRCCRHPWLQPKIILGLVCLLFAGRTARRNLDWKTEVRIIINTKTMHTQLSDSFHINIEHAVTHLEFFVSFGYLCFFLLLLSSCFCFLLLLSSFSSPSLPLLFLHTFRRRSGEVLSKSIQQTPKHTSIMAMYSSHKVEFVSQFIISKTRWRSYQMIPVHWSTWQPPCTV